MSHGIVHKSCSLKQRQQQTPTDFYRVSEVERNGSKNLLNRNRIASYMESNIRFQCGLTVMKSVFIFLVIISVVVLLSLTATMGRAINAS